MAHRRQLDPTQLKEPGLELERVRSEGTIGVATQPTLRLPTQGRILRRSSKQRLSKVYMRHRRQESKENVKREKRKCRKR